MFSTTSEVWKAYAAGHLTDDQAQQLHLQLAPAPRQAATPAPLMVTAKRYWIDRTPDQRSPDRVASQRRARMHAASGMMPPAIAALFTPKEQAALCIAAAEFVAHGVCDISQNEVGARAGSCKSVTRNAIYQAERLGLIRVERRPRSGRKHETNIMRVIDAEWLTWLQRGNLKRRAVESCTKAKPTFKRFRVPGNNPPRVPDFKNSHSEHVESSGEGLDRSGAGRAAL